jgi:nitrogen fixation protein FixH
MSLFQHDKPYELTGRHVLLWLVGFFGLVFVVNAVLVRAATSTFGGLETPSSYKAGLMFGSEIARAERQQALRWQVDGKLKRDRKGEAVFDISVRDAQGAPVSGLSADATLAHPADARLDRIIHLVKSGAGAFHGEAQAHSGQWELIVDFYRDHERIFRSRSRVTLR